MKTQVLGHITLLYLWRTYFLINLWSIIIFEHLGVIIAKPFYSVTDKFTLMIILCSIQCLFLTALNLTSVHTRPLDADGGRVRLK